MKRLQVTYKWDKPKVSTFEYTIWALGCDNHTVSDSVFSVSSYILSRVKIFFCIFQKKYLLSYRGSLALRQCVFTIDRI